MATHHINDYFRHIFCVNLDEATERWQYCEQQFQKFDIKNVNRFSAIKPEIGNKKLLAGELGILRSHYEMIKTAKEKNLPDILIFEDDFKLVDNFNHAFQNAIPDVPKDWDFLFFGGYHFGGLKMINKHIAKMYHSYAIHTVAINHSMYDLILDTITKEKKPLDVYYAGMMRKHNAYCLIPQLSFQRDGYSFIQQTNVNYQPYLDNVDIKPKSQLRIQMDLFYQKFYRHVISKVVQHPIVKKLRN